MWRRQRRGADALAQQDVITVLTCHKSLTLAKTFDGDAIHPYSNAKTFVPSERTVAGLKHLAAALDQLRGMPHRCVIRGRFIGIEAARERFPELLSEKYPDAATRVLQLFPDTPHHWVCFDIDNASGSVPFREDPAGAVEAFIRARLPAAFRDVSYYYCLSSSAGLSDKIKAHLWFWLERPYGSEVLKAWARALDLPIDKALFNPVQVHYTADPVFKGGAMDPIAAGGHLRSALVEGLVADTVSLDIAPDIVLQGEERVLAMNNDMPDPTAKAGWVGAVCRAYPIVELIGELLDDVFEFQDGSSYRLNFLQSASGAPGGAFITGDGHHVVNKHDSDPLENRAANAFDLIRVYRFGHFDETGKSVPNDVTKRQSYLKTVAWAQENSRVMAEMTREIEEVFGDEDGPAFPATNVAPAAAAEPVQGGASAEVTPAAAAPVPADGEAVAETGLAQRIVDGLNSRYCVVNEAGRVVIYEAARCDQSGRRVFNRFRFEDFRNLYSNRKVEVPRNGAIERVTYANLWLDSPARRQFAGGVVFDPSGRPTSPDVLNLWEGFAVGPKPGSWARIEWHMRNVLCGGVEEHYQYLLYWFANMVQNPASPGQVATVLRGGRGTGKGTMARVLMRIFGQHALQVSNSKYLTGQFNGHLRDCVFLFADEAFFAGDKKHESILKHLITEPTLTIEAKFQDMRASPNYVHILMASNEDWVVPAGHDERRYFVLEVGKEKQRDWGYLEALHEEIRGDGPAAFLHDLLALDLSDWNVWDAPATAGLSTQKLLSMESEALWWHDVLSRGYVWDSPRASNLFGTWQNTVATDLLTRSYLQYCNQHKVARPKARVALGRWLGPMAIRHVRTRLPVGEDRDGMVVEKIGATGYEFGPLAQARARFVQVMGLTSVDWPDVDGCRLVGVCGNFEDGDDQAAA